MTENTRLFVEAQADWYTNRGNEYNNRKFMKIMKAIFMDLTFEEKVDVLTFCIPEATKHMPIEDPKLKLMVM